MKLERVLDPARQFALPTNWTRPAENSGSARAYR